MASRKHWPIAAFVLVVAALVLPLFPAVQSFAQNVACYMPQGGASFEAGSGCSVNVNSGGTLNVKSGGSLEIQGVAISANANDLNRTVRPGRATVTICGEATTIASNTVYYGPDVTLAATSNGLTCDLDATGNTTEATADAPAFTNQAFSVESMACRNEGDANADVSFTLRAAEGATVPSVTCTISDDERDCIADVQTTTNVAAGATVAIAAASASAIGDDNGFVCEIVVAF